MKKKENSPRRKPIGSGRRPTRTGPHFGPPRQLKSSAYYEPNLAAEIRQNGFNDPVVRVAKHELLWKSR